MCGFSLCFITYWIFALNKCQLKNITNELKKIVDNSNVFIYLYNVIGASLHREQLYVKILLCRQNERIPAKIGLKQILRLYCYKFDV